MRIAICGRSDDAAVQAINTEGFDAAVLNPGGLIVVLVGRSTDGTPFKKVPGLLWAGWNAHTSRLPCFIFTNVEWEEALDRLRAIENAELITREYTP